MQLTAISRGRVAIWVEVIWVRTPRYVMYVLSPYELLSRFPTLGPTKP